MIKLATIDLTRLINDIDGIHPMDLEDKKGDLDDNLESFVEDVYLEFVFGVSSRLTYQEFLDKSVKSREVSDLWYKAANLRAFILSKIDVYDDDS